MQTINIGYIGSGDFAVARARRFAMIEGVAITLGWSRSAQSRERFSRDTGAKMAEHWQNVCESDDVDAIVVCTPHVFHFEQAHAALAGGKHVLVETPLCLSYDEAIQLANWTTADDLVIHHGTQFRYHPDHRQEIEHLHHVGQLVYAEKLFCFDGGPNRPWYRDMAFSGGGFSFLPWMSTDLFAAFGAALQVEGRRYRRDNMDVATMCVRFTSGGEAKMTSVTGENTPGIGALTVIGDQGAIQWTSDSPKCLVKGGRTTKLPPQREVDTVLYECQAFVDEIHRRRAFHPTFELDLRILKAVSAAQEQAQETARSQ